MDTAYDHIQEAVVEAHEDDKGKKPAVEEGVKQESLNSEFAEAYKAFSNSPWGASFGAFLGTVKKQVGCLFVMGMGWADGYRERAISRRARRRLPRRASSSRP